MAKLRSVLLRAALAAGMAGAVLTATAEPAAARLVCNRWHCWHEPNGYYDPYYDPYYGPAYYGPGYYGPGVTFGFGFGGGGHWHGSGGGWHSGHGHH